VIAARRTTLLRPSHRPAVTWGCLTTSCSRAKALAKPTATVGQDRRDDGPPTVWLSPQLRPVPRAGLGQDPALRRARWAAQTCLAQAAPPLGVWTGWSRGGATPPARVRPRGAAGSGPGWVRTRESTRTALRWAWWALGGAARNTGCSPVLMACSWAWSSAMAHWWYRWPLPGAGQTHRALEDRTATHGTGGRACSMGATWPCAGAVWRCPRRWSARIGG
jgi:hypothetical protein